MKDENSNIYLYFGIAALVLAAISFGLSFTSWGVYFLIASVILELTSLAFLTARRKKSPSKATLILTVFAYILLAASAALFVGGLVYSATRN